MGSISTGRKIGIAAWDLGLSGVAICFLGAIAGPKMMSFQRRARQAEAGDNLRNLSRAMYAYREQHRIFAPDLTKLGWRPEEGARYAYMVNDAERTGCPVTPGKDAEGKELRIGVTPTAFIALAVRAADDLSADCWTIASMDRVSPSGEKIPESVAFHESAAR